MGRLKLPTEQKKKAKSFNDKYPILFYVGTIPIREVNVVSIYINRVNMRKIARIVEGANISVAKVLAYSGKPCECCKNDKVTVVHDGVTIEIPRGLLSYKKTNSGTTITEKNKK